jgi:hypothetical protein
LEIVPPGYPKLPGPAPQLALLREQGRGGRGGDAFHLLGHEPLCRA